MSGLGSSGVRVRVTGSGVQTSQRTKTVLPCLEATDFYSGDRPTSRIKLPDMKEPKPQALWLHVVCEV